jgi:Fungalysin metallopeptidase (M36)/Bacterial Ig domain
MKDRKRPSSSTRSSRRSTRLARGAARTILAVALCGLTTQTGAQVQPPSMAPSDGYPNFDIRVVRDTSGDYRARVAVAPRAGELAAARIAGIAQLQRDGKTIDVIADGPLGSIEVMSARPGTGFLTAPAADRVAAMREFMATYPEVYGLSAEQIDALELVADYTNPAGNMSWVDFEQRVNGLPVFQGLIRGGFTASGELVRTTGPLAAGLVAAALPTAAGISAAAAVSRAAENVGWQVPEASLTEKSVEAAGTRVTFDRATMTDDATASLVYFPLAPGAARLAWEAQIWGDPHVYLVVLDAEDGTVLFRKNLTSFQTQPATYVVYSADSPAPLSPTTAVPGANTQAPFIARSTITLIGNEAPNTFNNLGWMTDGSNGVNGHTDGNNVEAGMDLVLPNGVDAPIPGANRVFDFAYDPAVQEPATAAYRNGEAAQMFYWANIFHDRTYLLGFTEAARNFQHDNFGRGGLGNDRLSAEGQNCDDPPQCPTVNNAFFTSPVDGFRGRMQMHLFPGPIPDRSSGLDQEVVLHELTHGLSNRLHNNSRGLVSNMSRGLGEGWSDFFARALLSTEDEDVTGVFATGGWVTHSLAPGYTDNYYYGIRRFPRAVRTTLGPNGKPHDPLTFADIDQTQINLTDGAFPRGPIGSNFADVVHNMGEVWAGALLEVRARFITRLGFAVGNQRILQFVTDGMKLDPANPTFLHARDAILAAANAGGGTAADIADIWAGFAARGMGVLAKVTDSGVFSVAVGTTRVFESFSVPGDPVPTFSINDVSIAEGHAGTTTATFTVTLTNPPANPTRVHIGTTDGTSSSSVSFSNSGTITFPPSDGPAAPSPSAIVVPAGLGPIQAISARLHSLSHTWPDDIDLLLVGPGGLNVLLMSDAGGYRPGVTGLDLTFRQGAPLLLAGVAPASGVYGPTNFNIDPFIDEFPPPAPEPPFGASLAIFNGSDPTGTWNLFAFDDTPTELGQIAGGWTLNITTAANDYVSKAEELVFPVGVTALPVIISINGDLSAELNETFAVNLSEPLGAVIGDGQGVGTILNDEGGPTTVADSYSTSFNTSLNIAAPGVLANDNANGGGTMTAAVVSNVSNGALVLAVDGGFTYTPNAGFTGTDTFTYRAVTAVGVGNAAAVPITVGPAFPPTTVNDTYSTLFETTLNVATPGVLANDNANGGSAVTAVLVDNVSDGVLTLAANGGLSYTPNAGFTGADTFTYRAVTNSGPGNVATVTITVGEPTTVQPPTELRVVSIVGNLVTLRWETVTLGPTPTDHRIEGGINPGEVLAGVNTGSPYPVFTFNAPTGAFYIRAHALRPGETSPASNEVRLFVIVPQVPSPPTNLLGVVNGSTLGLAWINTFEGGAPTSIALDVSGMGSILLPAQTDRFEFPSAPAGTYTLSVRAINAAGASGASNPVTLTIPGPCTGAPLAPANFLASKTGTTLSVIWDPPASGPSPTGYVVNVTGSVTGNVPTTARFLSGTVGPGTYALSVTAVNACGSATTPAQSVTIP